MGQVSLLEHGEQQLLDRYQLIGEIASGGMASVFLARLEGVGGFQRFVAIKRLHPHLASEPEFVEMFLDEARLAASIHHRNVVPILEIGTSTGGYYLVMEFIEGVTLSRLMTRAAVTHDAIPRNILLRVVIDTLSGLQAAHELTDDAGEPMGVVHRDCSPQNILVGHDGCTRITDFGIARASSRLHNTRDGAMKGKLAYMAPEQTQGEDFDRRADLFSVTVVLWEVLAQRRLFKSKTEAQTLRRLLHAPIPRLSDVADDIHPALDDLCAKGLDRDPDKRFQTAAAMADGLESAAREAGGDEPIATERMVESLMKARYGNDVDQQRDALRTWLQATPTIVGDAGPLTDKGWMGPTQSDAGARMTDRGWPLMLERKLAAGGEAGDSVRSKDQPAQSSKASLPQRWDGSDAGEDETNIYDPPSSTHMTGSTTVASNGAPTTEPSPKTPADGSGTSVRHLLLALVAAGLAAIVVFAVRDTTSDAGVSASPQTGESVHAPAAPVPSASSAVTAQPTDSVEPAVTAAPMSSRPRTSVTSWPRQALPSAKPSIPEAPPPSATLPPEVTSPPPEPPPPPPKAPPKPSEADDLANPYR